MKDLTFASLRGTRTAIHCSTKTEAEQVEKICGFVGVAKRYFEDFEGNTVIFIDQKAIDKNGQYDSLEYAREINYTIIPAAEFIAANSGEVEPEPISKDVVNMLLWISKVFDLAEGIWYWKEDEDGDNPLTETDLVKLWREHKLTAIGQIKAEARRIGNEST